MRHTGSDQDQQSAQPQTADMPAGSNGRVAVGQDQDANAHRKPLLEAAVKFSALPNDRDQRRAPTGARLMTRHSCARPLHRGVMLLDRPMRDEGASEHALSTRSRAVTAETPA